MPLMRRLLRPLVSVTSLMPPAPRRGAGLRRCPSALGALAAGPPAPPRGPGLFQIARANGETAITNIRRLAGAERAPGSRLVLAATVLLGLLAAGLFVVTLNAQYKYV